MYPEFPPSPVEADADDGKVSSGNGDRGSFLVILGVKTRTPGPRVGATRRIVRGVTSLDPA